MEEIGVSMNQKLKYPVCLMLGLITGCAIDHSLHSANPPRAVVIPSREQIESVTLIASEKDLPSLSLVRLTDKEKNRDIYFYRNGDNYSHGRVATMFVVENKD